MTAYDNKRSRQSEPSQKDLQDMREQLSVLRSGYASFTRDMEVEDARSMAQLEDQISELGANCPRSVLDAYDQVRETSRKMNDMLFEVGEGITASNKAVAKMCSAQSERNSSSNAGRRR